jgi:hypothetical protein
LKDEEIAQIEQVVREAFDGFATTPENRDHLCARKTA